jgi:hypothetical protein
MTPTTQHFEIALKVNDFWEKYTMIKKENALLIMNFLLRKICSYSPSPLTIIRTVSVCEPVVSDEETLPESRDQDMT